jgi:hypothetical protein
VNGRSVVTDERSSSEVPKVGSRTFDEASLSSKDVYALMEAIIKDETSKAALAESVSPGKKDSTTEKKSKNSRSTKKRVSRGRSCRRAERKHPCSEIEEKSDEEVRSKEDIPTKPRARSSSRSEGNRGASDFGTTGPSSGGKPSSQGRHYSSRGWRSASSVKGRPDITDGCSSSEVRKTRSRSFDADLFSSKDISAATKQNPANETKGQASCCFLSVDVRERFKLDFPGAKDLPTNDELNESYRNLQDSPCQAAPTETDTPAPKDKEDEEALETPTETPKKNQTDNIMAATIGKPSSYTVAIKATERKTQTLTENTLNPFKTEPNEAQVAQAMPITRLIAAEQNSEKRLIAAEDAEGRLIAAEEAPQQRDSGGLTEKEGQLDEWELDLIEREHQFDEERKAQEQKFAHMLDLADYEKDLADRAKKLESEEVFWDVKEKLLVEKEKFLTDKELVLDEKQIKLCVFTNKLNEEKETDNRKSTQVTPFLASQAALKKQNGRGLGSDDDATIAQLNDELEKLKEENERVKKDGSKGTIEELEKQHEEAVQQLQEGIDKQLFDALQTQLEEQVLVDEKLREKDASIENIQREMEELKEELEELLRQEAERGQKETQIDAVMEENELLQDQLEEEREESAKQISKMTKAVVRLQETNRELDEKIEAEAVKNKDMVIWDLEIEINELNIALEKQNTNEYAAKLRQEVKELKTELKKKKTELQDKEAGAYRHIQARDEAIRMLQKEVDRVYVELGNPIGTFEFDLPAPATPPPRVVEPSGFFGMLMGTS